MMRKILALAITALLCHSVCGFSATSLEEAVHKLRHQNKIYVSLDQLAILDEGMFVCFDDLWFQTNALFADESGLFLKDFRRKDDDLCPKYHVSCRNCHKCVRDWHDICPYCEKPV